jgi:DNA-binding GntR family transcriptional regulator
MAEPASLFGETEISGTNYGRVTDAIRDRIVGGVYQPGSRLKVIELCEQFGISSNPVREALQQLQGEGLVVILPNKGATVRLIDEKLIRHIYEIGAVLDGYLAARCAELATPAQVQRLRDIEEQLEAAVAAGQGLGRADRNRDFHTCFGEISGNTEAVSIRRRHHNLIRSIRMRYGFSSLRMEGIIAEHHAIIDAIASGDAVAAEQAARRHCLNSCDDMLTRYRGFSLPEDEIEQASD